MNQILTPSFEIKPEVLALAAKVKLLLFDVDGVLTDGRLVIGDDGLEFKAFNSRDGHGIKMVQRNGIAVGIITGRTSRVVYQKLIKKLKLKPEQTAYVGDDVVDLPIMLRVGLAVTVQNAHPLVRQHAHWITPSIGGYCAAREVCDMLLHAHGLYHAEMQRYLATDREPSGG
jgi:3-deoxy-D-manno-octulosonate 8-phosphate phosphatase (KDO 8-P phosphatase)